MKLHANRAGFPGDVPVNNIRIPHALYLTYKALLVIDNNKNTGSQTGEFCITSDQEVCQCNELWAYRKKFLRHHNNAPIYTTKNHTGGICVRLRDYSSFGAVYSLMDADMPPLAKA